VHKRSSALDAGGRAGLLEQVQDSRLVAREERSNVLSKDLGPNLAGFWAKAV
jgi:hypothetical protein